jgi:hypothetical protein
LILAAIIVREDLSAAGIGDGVAISHDSYCSPEMAESRQTTSALELQKWKKPRSPGVFQYVQYMKA